MSGMSAVAQPAIDLTGEDEWAGQERESKRQRTSTLPSQPGSQVATVSAPVTPAPSGPSTPTNGAQAQAQAPTWTQAGTGYPQWYGQYPPPGTPAYPSPYGYYPGYPLPGAYPPPTTTQTTWSGVQNNAIDLTGTPSPPAAPTASTSTSAAPVTSTSTSTSTPSASKVESRTVMCIGELSVTALILYPIRYLAPSNTASDATPATSTMPATCMVKLRYDASKKRIGSMVGTSSNDQTINIASPTTSAGPGEDFGVVDQKAANVLAPLMERGLIRQEARVVKGSENPSILPLKILLFTPKGNIPTISQHLSGQSLYLEHPCIPYNPADHRDSPPYENPHNPPPGGYRMRTNPGSSAPGRWNHSTTATGTSVEVQRSQVDEVFKSLMSGDDLDQTEAGVNVVTQLYPHQKEALTFLLEREKELKAPKSRAASLWTTRKDSKGRTTWYNIVTQKETRKEPTECKGAILADDMGLGKTISVVSLIARTLDSARSYGGASLHTPAPKPIPVAPAAPAAPFTAAHFAGSVWGMPSITPSSSNSKLSTPTPAPDPNKDKAKSRAALEDAQRAARLKTTSRATLIVCPLSTVANWEDQFKDHWGGEVVIVGGSPGGQVMPAQPMPGGQPGFAPHAVISGSSHTGAERIRVYVYHGPSRRPDPAYLADFDAVITTYSTLAVEYSRQVKSLEPIRAAQAQARQEEEEDEDEEDGNASDSASSDGIEETDQYGEVISSARKKVKKGVKRKKPGAMFTVGPEATSPLQSVNWFRIVLDEAHSIKEPTTIGSRACCDLIADRRLCLTGTPVQNKLDDVYALIKFIRLEPFDDKAVWTEYIGGPAKFGQPLGIARLQAIMKSITLRRTKETKKPDGTPILSLPPRRDELRLLQFEAEEKAVYDSYFTQSKAEFNQLSKTNQVMKNYVGILQKILRLRQICDHYELVKGKDEMTPLDYDAVLKAIVEEGLNLSRATAVFSVLRDCGTAQCVECQTELASAPPDAAETDALETDRKPGRKPKGPAGVKSQAGTRQNSPSGPVPVVTRCQHLYCIDCFRASVCPGWPKVPPNTQRSCSTCQSVLVPAVDAIQVQPDAAMTPEQIMAGSAPKQKRKEPRKKGGPLQSAKHSTKIKALIDDLMPFSRANPYSINYDPASVEVQSVDKNGNVVDDAPTKSVVFSQWTTMLDKIEDALEEAAIRFSRLDGTMKREERSRAMDALKLDPSCEVLLVSLRAGGVGLNLTAARRVYLMDPYWNPAVENQAVDRIHRLGQTKPVTTIKLIIENTIEARLLEVQKRKIELANMTLGVQLSKADQAQRRLEELSVLFK
ncbi:unnamed protein product [Rhizoctonia solani]|uniref:Uncharacterized protein n=1 Tax=Rhizoctonia solani TaxID=456999 RepID=A0A8H3B4Q9_9AGAM|nr:unnamed protein product [Rhizoctonia solani]